MVFDGSINGWYDNEAIDEESDEGDSVEDNTFDDCMMWWSVMRES